ncbi:HET-domain-containing protein [Ophiobolus disseminans]|uniref:HET-domain-containing protein n=1 Tax=Ophiobolus disseminans TaxID=1469910 RepID=A0A6A7A027_9PLEO|nr:HET-domain-containing protein [Ophiobolus disseminans]
MVAEVCRFCAAISVESLRSPDGVPHIDSIEAFSAYRDCWICQNLFLSNAKFRHEPEILRFISPNNCVRLKLEDSSGGTFFKVYVNEEEWRGQFGAIRSWDAIQVTVVEEQISRGFQILMEDDRRSFGSDFYVARARNWVRDCMENHTICNTSQSKLRHKGPMSTERWPRRLIHICNDQSSLNLVETCGLLEPVQYTCLSHCWGENGLPSTTKTTQESLDARMSHFELASLPRTFREAIQFTQCMGYKYIWIDALYIVQGLEDDWVREGAKMSDIYSNSVVMIAAESSTSSSGGLFSNTIGYLDGDANNEFKLGSVLADGRTATLVFHPISSHVMSVSKKSLESRCWTFQERLFSPRILHFFDEDVLWECSQHYGTSFSSDVVVPQLCISKIGVRFGQMLQAPSKDYDVYTEDWERLEHNDGPATLMEEKETSQAEPPGEPDVPRWLLYKPWYWDVLEAYTRRKVTFHSDKLLAVSSIARAIARHVNSAYLAGLWEEDIAFGLAWTVLSPVALRIDDPKARHVIRAHGYPSWSWSAYDVACYWYCRWPVGTKHLTTEAHQGEDYKRFGSHLELLSHRMHHATADPFGEVLSGRLHIRGRVLFGNRDSDLYQDVEPSVIMRWRVGELVIADQPRVQDWITSFGVGETMDDVDSVLLLLCNDHDHAYFLVLDKVDGHRSFQRRDMACLKFYHVSFGASYYAWVKDSRKYDLELV